MFAAGYLDYDARQRYAAAISCDVAAHPAKRNSVP